MLFYDAINVFKGTSDIDIKNYLHQCCTEK